MLIERKSFKKLNWKSVGQSALEGAISGAIAGATGGASLAASAGKQTAKLTAKQVAKTAAKTAVVHGTTGAAINATAQYAVKGEINASEVALSGAIDFVTGGVGSALPHTKVGNAIKTFTDNAETKAKGFINKTLDNTRIILGNERGSIGGTLGNNIDDVVDAGTGEVGRLNYKPTSEVDLVTTLGKTTTVLGTYAKDTGSIINEIGNLKSTNFGPRENGFNLLNVPDELYQNPKQFWNEYNKPWLDNAIQRNDTILMATKPEFKVGSLFRKNSFGKLELSGFGKEYSYLRRNGYVFDPVTNQMIKK